MKDHVRVNFDMDSHHYQYIKMLAVKEKKSLREFICERLPAVPQGKGKDKIDEIIDEMCIEYNELFKNLSDR